MSVPRLSQPGREQLRIAIVTWIERTYHRRRREVGLSRLPQIEYELSFTQDTLTAVS